jgi:LacI family transcriptional regulator
MSTIAARAGVSKNTVSLALRHDPQIPAATRARIEVIARRLGYTLNPVVAELMSELRRSQAAPYRRTLALINANHDEHAFTRHPTVPAYVTGCRRRAAQLGYALDYFWLHAPDLRGPALARVLRARGIRGALVVGLMKDNRLPAHFTPVLRQQSVVVTGVRTREPTLSFACVDHHALVLEAMSHAQRLGYRRPALVLERTIDRLVDGRFTAGFWCAQRNLPPADHTEAFLDVELARSQPALFHTWLAAQKPDVILTLHTVVSDWLEAAGLRIPRDQGLIQLERRRGCADWSGLEQHNDLVGEAAVDLLLSTGHRADPGPPASPRATLIHASWSTGRTTRRPRARPA